MASNWRTDKPNDDRWVEVWNHTHFVRARWTDAQWLDRYGNVLSDISHWREL